ncbi:MAG: hypothetical protein HY316_10025 [Acidobacteria bacterium]|nr:hypothetical protein [Acidobacteriota bacterium]
MSIAIAALALILLTLQAKPPDLRFEDYPAGDIFRGTPAAPKIVEPWVRMYRIRIREGISKGSGVHHYDEPQVRLDRIEAYPRGNQYNGPNFAGHYFVVTWGCGTGCLRMAVVDAITGKIYPPPLSVSKQDPLVIPMFGMGWALFDFRVESRLFAMSTCTEKSAWRYSCHISYFTMETTGFELVKRVELPEMSLAAEP